ncbi:histone H1-I [Augochlora pura]
MEDKTNSGSAAVSENPSSGSSPAKKAAKSKTKAQRSKSSHPPTSEMVNAAIKELKDRKGSSLQAIKKYIASTYKVDGEKLAPFIKRYLKTAVTSGAVVQTKGKGASGSFKLSAPKGSAETKSKPKRVAKKSEVADKKPAEKKPASPKKPAAKKPAAKKPAAVKKAPAPKKVKTPAAKKTDTAAKQKAVAQAKSLSKAKKAIKSPAAKMKTPKPKTAKSPKAKAAAKK